MVKQVVAAVVTPVAKEARWGLPSVGLLVCSSCHDLMKRYRSRRTLFDALRIGGVPAARAILDGHRANFAARQAAGELSGEPPLSDCKCYLHEPGWFYPIDR